MLLQLHDNARLDCSLFVYHRLIGGLGNARLNDLDLLEQARILLLLRARLALFNDEVLELVKVLKEEGRAVTLLVLVAALLQYLVLALVNDLLQLLLLLR